MFNFCSWSFIGIQWMLGYRSNRPISLVHRKSFPAKKERERAKVLSITELLLSDPAAYWLFFT